MDSRVHKSTRRKQRINLIVRSVGEVRNLERGYGLFVYGVEEVLTLFLMMMVIC